MILGAGESGVGSAILGHQKGYDVFVSDKSSINKKYKKPLEELNIRFEEGKHSEIEILNADEVVKSPGISGYIPLVQNIRKKKIPIRSEIEFAFQYCNSFIIGITGSNGKTTTTCLITHILKNAGVDAIDCGNIGVSFAERVARHPAEVYVLELSSFQLDDIETFRPDIAVLTSLTPDHLDRYQGRFDFYINSKFRIIENQTDQDAFIVNVDDKEIQNQLKTRKITPRLYPFTLEEKEVEGAYRKGDQLIVKTDKTNFEMTIKELALQGKHNVRNSMASGIVASLMNIRKETIRKCLSDFQAVEHRLEPVLKIHKMNFINDSKATNVNATYYALESMENPTVWIAGGIDKGNDYSELIPVVCEKVRAIVCIGVNNSKIIDFFKEYVPIIVDTQSMKKAVRTAYMLGKKGDNVLLSPACASFDLFENFKDRGKQFKEEIKKL